MSRAIPYGSNAQKLLLIMKLTVIILLTASLQISAKGLPKNINKDLLPPPIDIKGRVTDKTTGAPLAGASIVIKGSSKGTTTNANGEFSLQASEKAVLQFTFVGYASQLVTVGTGTTINVSMELKSNELGQVIITGALGIKRASREVGYSTQLISNKELNQSSVTNIANGLTAKVSGLQVNTVNNGIDPGTRITLRGNRSINGNNTALVVLNGVPVPSSTLNSINPNDILDVNVLKGASAAALYGSEASNGALIITTKKGAEGSGKPVIKYGNSLQLQTVSYFPELQNKFGLYGGEGAPFIDPLTGFTRHVPFENQNYGPLLDGSTVPLGPPLEDGTQKFVVLTARKKAPIKEFFETGLTEQNDISFSQGDADNSFFFSIQNVYSKGVVPKDVNKRISARVGASKKYGIFKADFSIGYTNSQTSTYGLDYGSTFASLYRSLTYLPAFLDIRSYSDPSEAFSNPSNFYDDYAVNPYWQIVNSRINYNKDIILGNLNLNLAPTKWFDITYRVAQNFGTYQRHDTRAQVDFTPYSVSDPTGNGNIPSAYPSGKISGRVSDYIQYGDGGTGYSRLQQDAILNFHHTFFTDFKTELLLGNTIWEQKYKFLTSGSNDLLIPDYYNINFIAGSPSAGTGESLIRQMGVYGSLNVGYKDFAFIEVTGRNDYDSRLSKANRSFFYPSVKGSFIFTNAIKSLANSRIISYGKLRAAYSEVGQVNIGPYSINNTFGITGGFPYGSLGGLTIGSTNNNPNLKPEKVKELEFGTELGFFNNRINLGATYYKQNTVNQTLGVDLSPATGYSASVINAGEIENKGFEFDLKLAALQKSKNSVGLDLGGNLGIYDSKVISLLPGVANEFQLSGGGGNIFAVVGEQFPVRKGSDLLRDPEGRVIVSKITGYPSRDPTQKIFGRTTPKYILGLNFGLSYKFVSLSAVAEYRGGYVIYNQIGRFLDAGGITARSAAAGRQRFIYPNSVIKNADGSFTPNTEYSIRDGNYGFWQESVYEGTTSTYLSSAAFWKLREVNLSFNLSQFVKNMKYIKGLTVAFTGRNLLMLKPKSNPFTDPEFGQDASNGGVGSTSINELPPTRFYGANIQITF